MTDLFNPSTPEPSRRPTPPVAPQTRQEGPHDAVGCRCACLAHLVDAKRQGAKPATASIIAGAMRDRYTPEQVRDALMYLAKQGAIESRQDGFAITYHAREGT